jgi:ribonuclease HII
MARSDTQALYDFDVRVERQRACRVVGLDEAGRGPLAGPVVAAAVVLDLSRPIDGVFDSKQVSGKKREALYGRITAEAAAWSVGQASVEEIEGRNILRASLLAMRRALDKIGVAWSLALIDGNQIIPGLDHNVQCTVVKGDAASASIAAASIIAKVSRDRIMSGYHAEFPDYGFSRHKGYGTAFHIDRIRALGLCRLHRASFCARFVRQPGPDLAGAASRGTTRDDSQQ